MKRKNQTWIIKDWAGNVCFKGKEFKTFDDGWEYVWINDPCSEDDAENGYYDDYYVELKEESEDV